jgi:hypothetical protein
MSYNISHVPNSNIPIYTNSNGTIYYAGGKEANCTVSACPIELSVYGYRPSIPASAILIALYVVCILVQSYLGFKYKTWLFMSMMLLGCVDEIIGYIGRILYWQNPWKQAGFIIQIGISSTSFLRGDHDANQFGKVLITIGPVFFSAAIYVELSRMSDFILPSISNLLTDIGLIQREIHLRRSLSIRA